MLLDADLLREEVVTALNRVFLDLKIVSLVDIDHKARALIIEIVLDRMLIKLTGVEVAVVLP